MGDFNRESFYQFFIRHCAPTMASLKCANMMSCPNDECYREDLAQIAEALAEKGVRVRIIHQSKARILILVYRPAMLAERFADEAILHFMNTCGYCQFEVEETIDRLQARIADDPQNFPHEIGVFLGYPLEDIKGFIENRGKNGLCCGEWKVYHEPEKARKIFANLKKCRDIYYTLFSNGTRTLTQLTVAA